MKTSESIAEIAGALAAFNAEVPDPVKGHTADVKSKKGEGSSYSFGYADLQDITETVRAPLAAQGLSIIQDLVVADGSVGAAAMIMHKSGEWLQFSPAWVAIGSTPDGGVTGAVTTSRRISLMAALNLGAAEDPAAPKGRRTSGQAGGKNASSKQIAKAKAEAERGHVTEGALRKVVRTFGVDAADKTLDDLLGMLTIGQASELIERLIKEADRRASAKAAGADPETGEVPPTTEPADAGPPEDPDADTNFWQGEAPGDPPTDPPADEEPPGMDAAAARKSWEKSEPAQGGLV